MTRVLAVLTILFSMHASAQSPEDSVKQTINRLFEGMKKSDTAMMRSVFASSAILQTIARTRDGKTVVRSENVDSFLVSIARPHTDEYDERIIFETVRIDGDLAIAWTPYKFFVGSRFSHCGVNSFQLVRSNGAWAIQYLIDTRRRQNCE